MGLQLRCVICIPANRLNIFLLRLEAVAGPAEYA
jgi:hypothetical protein